MKRTCTTSMMLAVVVAALGGAATAAASPRALVVDDDRMQCAQADFTSIQTAVGAASAGDVIHVCPGVYDEGVTVSKPLTIKGDPNSIEAQDCLTPTAPDPTRDAIVDPPDDGFSVALSLRANGVVVEGLVVQGASVGLDSSDDFSGYRIDHNLIQQTTLFAMDMGSDGGAPSRVDHNCLRQNHFGLVSELDDDSAWSATDTSNRGLDNARDLSDALIDHNTTFANLSGLEAAGPGRRRDVRFDSNVSRDDQFAIEIQNSTDSAIVGNQIYPGDFGAPHRFGIALGGANENLAIRSNELQGGRNNVIFFTPGTAFIDHFFAKSEVVMTANVSIGATATGIGIAAGSVENSLFSSNTSSGNATDGFIIQSANTGNTFSGNVADANLRNGIYAAGATGNTFQGNEMLANGGYDARDNNGPSPLNTWTGNTCVTDNVGGAICGIG